MDWFNKAAQENSLFVKDPEALFLSRLWGKCRAVLARAPLEGLRSFACCQEKLCLSRAGQVPSVMLLSGLPLNDITHAS